MRQFLLVLFAVVCLCLPAAARAQSGSLSGLVRDRESHEGLIGVDVVLVGTGRKTMTDLDGRFALDDLESGDYELRLTYMGYNTKFLTGIVVEAGHLRDLTIDLESFRAHQTDDMVISGSRIMSTEGALLSDRRRSAVVGDAISAAQISRSPDGNSGDALKRVPGLTVNEGKYVFVRGVTDRYNVTEVNGVTMSGTNVEKDRKSFNFDMVPANLLANVTVIKTATPDLPGDFAGGLVRVNTLEFPEQSTTAVGVSMGYQSGTTGEPFQHDAQRGRKDWLGIDDGDRAFPADYLSYGYVYRSSAIHNTVLAKHLRNRWTTRETTAPPKISFNLSHGGKQRFLGLDIGYMGAMSYRDSYDTSDDNKHREIFQNLDASGRTSEYEVTWGGLGNLFLRRGRSKIGFTNIYNRKANEIVSHLVGKDQTIFDRTTMSWQERYQFVDKVDGEHHLPGPGGGFELKWQGYYGESHAEEPDRRYLQYNIEEAPIMNENARMWTWLDEYRRGAAVDLAWSPAADEFDRQYNIEFKTGYRKDRRTRNFDVQSWDTRPGAVRFFDGNLPLLPPETIFAPENYNDPSDPRRGAGWEFAQDLVLSGIYEGAHDLQAWYGMVDIPFTFFQEQMRLTGGARVEQSEQLVTAIQSRLQPDRRDTSLVYARDLLPSVALTWLYDEDLNIRLGYYESVNRPEFREMAPVTQRDYREFEDIVGNPDLKRARIRNYDVRMEYFPGAGEVLAASAFYKRIEDAIESTFEVDPFPFTSWSNAPQARNWGFELEARKRLDFVAPSRGFTLTGNYTRVWSEVPYDDQLTPNVKEELLRPLHGQAPWSLNLGLQWDSPREITSLNVLYNKVGRRLDKISESELMNIYLEPRGRLDLVVTHRIGRGFKAKLAASDLLAEDTVKTSGGSETTYVYSRLTEGTSWSLSLSGRF